MNKNEFDHVCVGKDCKICNSLKLITEITEDVVPGKIEKRGNIIFNIMNAFRSVKNRFEGNIKNITRNRNNGYRWKI